MIIVGRVVVPTVHVLQRMLLLLPKEGRVGRGRAHNECHQHTMTKQTRHDYEIVRREWTMNQIL